MLQLARGEKAVLLPTSQLTALGAQKDKTVRESEEE